MSLFDGLEEDDENTLGKRLVFERNIPPGASRKKTVRKKKAALKKTASPMPGVQKSIEKNPPENETKTKTENETVAVPLSVAELTFAIREALEGRFSDVRVVGEVSNVTRPRSGHVYLTLKDRDAQIPAVLWKPLASRVKFELKDGMEVVCRGRVEVYPPHGKYQLILSELQPKGTGVLELAFRRLHARLAAEGLFDPSRKRAIPRRIRRVAVVTSISGAALRDFLQVLGRRTHRVDVRIVPVSVQGDGAAREIAAAIRLVNEWTPDDFRDAWADCIVVTRGGGSAEDLWAFNEEPLVRAVAGSRLPVISAVGHEIDVSLCDLAADLRALTPSEAAERIAPEDSRVRRELLQLRQFLETAFEKTVYLRREAVRSFMRHPILARPEKILENRRHRVDLLEQTLDRTVDQLGKIMKERIAQHAASLGALSPLDVLSRGYSLTHRHDGSLVTDANMPQPGEHVRTRLANGTFESEVLAIRPEEKENKHSGTD